jgi:hypothetical protein
MAINFLTDSQYIGSLSISEDGANATVLSESASGDFTIDAVDDIRLDAGGGDIAFRDDDVEFGRITNNSGSGIILKSSATNTGIYIQPNGTGNVYCETDTLIVSAAEAEPAKFLLRADQGDDDGDDWYIINQTDNALEFTNTISGSQVTHLEITPNASVASSSAAFGGSISAGAAISSTTTMSAGTTMTIGTIDEVGSDTDKFLMSESGVVTYVTGANLRSYIGAGTGSGSVTGTGTATRVAFWSDTSVLSSNADLYWDNTNDRLGIGTSSITSSRLDVYSTTADPQGVMKVTQAVASNDPTMVIEHTVAGGNANEDTGLVIKSVGSGAGNQFVLNAYKENGTDYAFKVNGGGDTYSANDAYIEGSVVFSSDDGVTCSKVNWLEYVCPDTGTSVNSKIGYFETNFPDNSKVTFGDLAGGDLQIYHDGSDSFISDTGTGDLYVKASNNFFVESSAGASKIIARTGGAVDLYHNGSKKIETTSTGVDITGGFTTSASSSCAGLNMTADIAMAGNDITLDSGGNIELDASLSGGQTSGTIIKFGSGTLTAGDVYYAYTSMGTQWGTVNHTSDNTTKLLALAIGTSATSNGMLLNGIFYKALHGFTVGAPLYLASSNGDFTTTVPTTSNYYARVLGYAIDSSHIYFCPDNTWVKID